MTLKAFIIFLAGGYEDLEWGRVDLPSFSGAYCDLSFPRHHFRTLPNQWNSRLDEEGFSSFLVSVCDFTAVEVKVLKYLSS